MENNMRMNDQKYSIGHVYVTVDSDMEIVEYSDRYKMYRIKNLETGEEKMLVKQEEIDYYMENLEKTNAKKERLIAFRKEQNELQEKAKKKQMEKEIEDNREIEKFLMSIASPAMRARAKKHLNREMRYNGNLMKNKDVVVKILETVIEISEIEKIILMQNNIFLTFKDISKTQRNFLEFLMENK